MKGGTKFLEGTKIGGTQKGPKNKVMGDYKPDTFGKKNQKAPSKRIKA